MAGWHRCADVAEDVTELAANGETPERIATRLGMTPAAIARAMYRAERPDLARPFNALDKRTRRRNPR